MRKIILVYTLIFAVLVLTACASKAKEAETPSPSPTAQSAQTTKAPAASPTETPSESKAPSDIPTSAPQEVPAETEAGFVQKEGAISLEEAVSILRTFLGSYDENGHEFSFGYENSIEKDGREYYNFRVSSLIPDGTGSTHESLYGNYIISSDGMDIEEYNH